jgi:sugar phosphate isomerase/epimerase
MAAVDALGEAIHHVHAKDNHMNEAALTYFPEMKITKALMGQRRG